MTQTTGAMSWIAARGFLSDDLAVSWTDIGPAGVSVAVSGGERSTGEQNTMDGDTPVLKSGKRASLAVTVRFVYTEEATEPFELARAQYETAGGAFRFQWGPKDGFWYDTGDGIITNLLYPGGEVGPGTIIMSEFVVKCASITKATSSTAAGA